MLLYGGYVENLHYNNAVVNVIKFRHKPLGCGEEKIMFWIKIPNFGGTIPAGNSLMSWLKKQLLSDGKTALGHYKTPTLGAQRADKHSSDTSVRVGKMYFNYFSL